MVLVEPAEEKTAWESEYMRPPQAPAAHSVLVVVWPCVLLLQPVFQVAPEWARV